MIFLPCSIIVENDFQFGELKIRKITDSDYDFLGRDKSNAYIDFSKRNNQNVFLAQVYLVEYMYISNSIIEYDYEEKKSIDSLIDFFKVCRLIKKGNIYCLYGYSADENKSSGITINQKTYIETKDEEIYNIEDTEYGEIIELYDQMKKSPKSFLSDIFSYCFTLEQKKENVFISMVSILEILIYDKTKDEIGFRFELFITFLLKHLLYFGKVDREIIKKIYKVRSNIVHSGEKLKENENEIFIYLIDITRFLLKNYFLGKVNIGEVKGRIFEKIISDS